MTRLALTLVAVCAAGPALAAGDKPFFSRGNTDFIVLISFLIFVGILVYFKVPGLLTGMLDKRAAGIKAEVSPFFADIAPRIAAAHLVISRSGASSIADISVIGRPSILIPFAAATGDHQTANARFLADQGAGVLVADRELDGDRLRVVVEDIIGDADRRVAMGRAAASLGRPDAASDVALLIEEHARD